MHHFAHVGKMLRKTKKHPVPCYITQNRAIKKRRIIKSGKRRPGSVHRDGYARGLQNTIIIA